MELLEDNPKMRFLKMGRFSMLGRQKGYNGVIYSSVKAGLFWSGAVFLAISAVFSLSSCAFDVDGSGSLKNKPLGVTVLGSFGENEIQYWHPPLEFGSNFDKKLKEGKFEPFKLSEVTNISKKISEVSQANDEFGQLERQKEVDALIEAFRNRRFFLTNHLAEISNPKLPANDWVFSRKKFNFETNSLTIRLKPVLGVRDDGPWTKAIVGRIFLKSRKVFRSVLYDNKFVEEVTMTAAVVEAVFHFESPEDGRQFVDSALKKTEVSYYFSVDFLKNDGYYKQPALDDVKQPFVILRSVRFKVPEEPPIAGIHIAIRPER